jgi:hypothetical protein
MDIGDIYIVMRSYHLVRYERTALMWLEIYREIWD